MRYFVCTIGNFGEYRDQIDILKECLARNIYQLHRDARWPSPLSEIQKDATLLLKIQNQLVAWSVAKGPVRIESPDHNDGWNRVVNVNYWRQYDPKTPASGVHHYGIQEATLSGAGQFAIVKEVDGSWAEEKLATFKNSAIPRAEHAEDGFTVKCRQQSLIDLFAENLSIPDYQRCFCWRRWNITDLLETLRGRANQETPDTHLGTIILKRDGDDLCIVDGQQRLLTLTILAFCISGRRDKDALPLPLLQASLKDSTNEAYLARKHIYWAKTTIDEWLRWSGLSAESLQLILASIQFCVVILGNNVHEDLAYTFFNAVNASGKKLSDYDLLKAHHLRFIGDEDIAKRMAERWDKTGAEGYDEILHKTLYRLRTWRRFGNPLVDAQDGHHLFDHFSAKASTVTGIFFPPLAICFNSTIHGGASFFHYAEQYRMLWEDFRATEAYALLIAHLSGHSRNVLRDTIGAILFLFCCKFGKSYLLEALFCIADVVSVLRNEYQVRATAIQKEVLKEILVSLDAAIDPGQFFDWCLSPERHYTPSPDGKTRKRFWTALYSLYEAMQTGPFALSSQCGRRRAYLTNQ